MKINSAALSYRFSRARSPSSLNVLCSAFPRMNIEIILINERSHRLTTESIIHQKAQVKWFKSYRTPGLPYAVRLSQHFMTST